MDPNSAAAVDAPSARVLSPGSGGRRRAPVRTWSSAHQARLARVAAVGLWALVAVAVAGGVAGVVSLAGRGEAARSAPGAGAEPSSPAAEGFAELYVMTWLSAGEGQESELLGFSPDPVSLEGRKPGTARARWVGTVGSRLVEPGYWSVTVAAQVEQAVPGGYEPAGLRYYRVPVLAKADGLVVTALPSQVPAPARAERPPLDLTANAPLPAGELADTIDRFFVAYLTEQGDVERYVRPGANLHAVVPPPFTETKVTAGDLRETGNAAGAAVQVAGRDAAGRTTTTAYSLRLLRRDGRWEVAEILPVPPLAPVTGTNQKGPSS